MRTILKETSFENKLPDLGILIDIDPHSALERMKKRGMDFFDKNDISYFATIRKGLVDYAKEHGWIIVSGNETQEYIHSKILNDVITKIANPP